MSWLSDKINPTDPAQIGPFAKPRITVLIKLPIAIVLVALALYLIFANPDKFGDVHPIFIALLIPLYAVLGYYCMPPVEDRDEHGFWAHVPRRYWLYALIVLWPGWFVAQTLLDAVVMLRYAGESSDKQPVRTKGRRSPSGQKIQWH